MSVHAQSAPFQTQLALIQEGHSAEAYQQLSSRYAASAGNPDFDTAYGLAALDNGATAEAVAALERVLAQQPDNLPVRTELARAYEKIGDPAAAARELKIVEQSPQTPTAVRINLSQYTTALDEALTGGPDTIHATITAATGYDTNINNATTSSYLVVPALSALGPARLSGGSKAEDSAYAEAGATLTYRKPISMSKTLFATVGANQKSPFETSDYTQSTITAEAGIQLQSPDNGKLTLAANAQQFWFGGEDYSTTVGAAANWQLPLSISSNLTTYLAANHTFYNDASSSDTNRITLGTVIDNRWQTALTPYTFAGAYIGTEQASESSADYLSNNLVGLRAGFELYPSETLSIFTDATYEIRDYEADYPLFMNARLDRQLDISTGISYAIAPRLLLRPAVSYRYAQSNIAFYNYTRWLANIGLRYSF